MFRKRPVMVFRDPGRIDDELDVLAVAEMFEDPRRWEEAMNGAFAAARTDASLAEALRSAYLEEDRVEAFERFRASSQARAVAEFIARFGVGPDSAVCDLGCGPGHLAHALAGRGFNAVSAMDPNGEWYTGTGLLKSVAGGRIEIINELREWRRIRGRFDAIVSQGTIHHWQHIPLVALDARRTMKPGAFWFAFSEFFANTARELAQAVATHPTASRLGSYEWAYPASAYADLIQSVGFALVAVVPYFYRRNELVGSMRPAPPDLDVAALERKVDRGLVALGGSVEMFWGEVDKFRRQAHGHRLFTEPQVMVFQRVAC
jgi:2-polyprenyl-3-methyl-5-hydroxy-6-metoxy-1,4-benzoquinol methylase